jgi:hypothetical protein
MTNPFRAPNKIPHHVATRTNPETYSLDFTNHLATAETLSSVLTTTQRKKVAGQMQTTTDLTLGTPAVNVAAFTPPHLTEIAIGKAVQITCKGGTAGYTYEIEFLVRTSTSRDISGVMTLEALS